MHYQCSIENQQLRCSLIPDRDLTDAVFCCSAMAPLTVTDGGRFIKRVGSYTEIELPALSAGTSHTFFLAYTQGMPPANRAWLPQGPCLRTGKGIISLPPSETGFKPLAATEATALPQHVLRLAPQPVDWQPATGSVFIESLRFESSAFDCGALTAASKLAVRRQFGTFIDPDGFPATLKSADVATDGYQLQITTDGVVISANSYGGRFYAAITLLTLMQNHKGNIPLGTITDAPRFAWRGQHLDTARHYYETDTIFELLDLMALLKLNRFHWHFADDEAFRLQIDCYPELWQQTEMRGEGHLLPAIFSADRQAGGSYSKQEVRQLLERAAELNIEILPEIEAPAHALAFARIFPQTRDPDDTGTETSVQGYEKNVVNPAMPHTWEILAKLVREVGALFPFGHVHLGCDELPANTWSGSPRAKLLMARHNLQTRDDLSGWFIAKLAAMVEENGQRPAAWEEAVLGSNGGIGHNALLFSWSGQGPGIQAARNGYDIVMCPAQHVYLDMAHSDNPDDWGANWAAYVSLADTIAWDPVPNPEIADKIIGVQGAFWSEFTTRDEQMWPMILPRILGIAVKAWQEDDIRPGTLAGLAVHYKQSELNIPAGTLQKNTE
ncbi:glycosyl hydrolase [Chromatiales bacterium (ex Bugula neritina AB1)]|nr:glycosyl hydrolase [Chromatiales bacterium (ex Bugula neritina AB1)]